MLTFIAGFLLGGFMGFVLCGLVNAKRIEELNDRRGQDMATFPLTDCDGVVAHDDRRSGDERRLGRLSHEHSS